MQATSIIGQSITITGNITADEPLTIAGRVDGTVSIPGHSLTSPCSLPIPQAITTRYSHPPSLREPSMAPDV